MTVNPSLKALQRALNQFTGQFLRGINPVVEDGIAGPATDARVKLVKFYLGYDGVLNATADADFNRRMHQPADAQFSTPERVARGAARRAEQHKQANASGTPTSGVGSFDGIPCASWMIPYLSFARAHGWQGTLQSGFRDPAHSEHICQQKCGHPTCPGTCAGRSSNHSGSVKPEGAIDVSDFNRFGQIMATCPLTPHILNDLPNDRVHFSASGH